MPAPEPRGVRYERLHAICMALPGVEEGIGHSAIYWQVKKKIFAAYEAYGDAELDLYVRVDPLLQEELLHDPRFAVAKYTGKHGGTTMSLQGRVPWKQVEAVIIAAWRLVAPKRIVKACVAQGPENH